MTQPLRDLDPALAVPAADSSAIPALPGETPDAPAPAEFSAAPAAAPSTLAAEVERRRTFAIISHPDAGKTTLTEKLLLFGGAINLARRGQGQEEPARHPLGLDVDRARARHLGRHLGDDVRLPRPGLQPARHAGPRGLFGKTPTRTLTAVDSAVMVIDAAKGIEARTRKLFEVCRAARHSDRHLHQQDGPREPRSLRDSGRDREERWRSTPRR